MFTSEDQEDEIYKLLNVPSITSVISGSIIKGGRPDSGLEDIVINSLSLGDGTRQFGVANVNIYVNDVATTLKGKPVMLKNSARLKTLVNLVKPILEETDGAVFALWIEDTQTVAEPDIKQHFINLRIEVRMYNDN